MKATLAAVGTALSLWATSAGASQVLTFDDLQPNYDVPSTYQGLTWENFGVGIADGAGYNNAVVSPPNIIFNDNENPAAISSFSSDFSLESAYFTAAWNDGLNVSLTAYDGSQQVASDTFIVNTSGPTFENINFVDVTSVTLSTLGGVPNPAYVSEGAGTQVAIDNLTVTSPSAAPEPATWLLMLAGIGGIGFAYRQAKCKHDLRLERAVST